MVRQMSVSVLATCLALYACSKDPNAGRTVTDGGKGGTGGMKDGAVDMGGAPDTKPADAQPDGAGGMDGAQQTDAQTDGSGGAAAITWPTMAENCGSSTVPAVNPNAEQLCSYFAQKCMFAAGKKFSDMGACVSRVNSYTQVQKDCAIYHMCVAGLDSTHCTHPSESGAPCSLP